MSDDTQVLRALRRARAVSTRDLNSWLLAARAMGGDTARLTLAGCPSVRSAYCDRPPAKAYDLALNLSFVHENCRLHVPLLVQIARSVRAQRRRVLWIAHSKLDQSQAMGVNRQLRLGFDVVRPRSGAEAGAAYAACNFALVTRFHAGIFCLANSIPFGFIGYDVKCWHLMSMFADEPHHYVLPIDQLTESGVENDIARLFQRIESNAEPLRRAERLLAAYFDAQTDRFVDAAVAAVHPSRRVDGKSATVENPAHKVTGTHAV
jgi:polysaccharide pyruvyl transferase WcaK-like protein